LIKDEHGVWMGGSTTDDNGFDLDTLEEDMGVDVTLDFASRALPAVDPGFPFRLTPMSFALKFINSF